MDIDLLRSQHEDISETARHLRVATAHNVRPDGIGHLRWRLARQLMAHLALEDQIVYPLIQRCQNEAVRHQACQLQAETGRLGDIFNAYMRQWSEDRITLHWADFCMETRMLLNRLEDRIHREEHGLYPAAQRAMKQSASVAA